MAKRKRLKPAAFTRFEPKPNEAALETKAEYPMGVALGAVTRAPIAQVAGDTAAHAALEELVDEVDAARSSGRLVLDMALDSIKADHLLRDRMGFDPEEMDALKASLRARGQQTPIEVIELEEDSYGLISGWRRLTALQELKAETGEARFDKIQALIKPIEGSSDSYIAMVEENEIRAGLSFYERALVAFRSAEMGVYAGSSDAVSALFANVKPAKRSKINAFVKVVDHFHGVLIHPQLIPEKLGLALAAASADLAFVSRLRDSLRKSEDRTAQQERATLERALRKTPKAPASAVTKAKLGPELTLESREGRVVLTGKAVTAELSEELQSWLEFRMRKSEQ